MRLATQVLVYAYFPFSHFLITYSQLLLLSGLFALSLTRLIPRLSINTEVEGCELEDIV